MNKNLKVPFDKHGNQLPNNWLMWATEYKLNYIFHATLTFKTIRLGSSAINFIWEDVENHKEYISGLKFLCDVLNGTSTLNVYFKNRKIHLTGNFCFKKQGPAILLTYP